MINIQVRLTRFLVSASLMTATGYLCSLPAKAVVVSVGGTNYDVLVTNRSYNEDPSFFSPGLMPWFTGDSTDNSLAYDFAQAVNNQLGSYTYAGFPGSGGPLFAYAVDATNVFAVFQDSNNAGLQNDIAVTPGQPYPYAYGIPVASPTGAPGPLPLAGAAIGFRWSRSLRTRLGRRNGQKR